MRPIKWIKMLGLVAVISVGAAACSSSPTKTATNPLDVPQHGLTLYSWKTNAGTGVGSIDGIVAYADKNESGSKIECTGNCTNTWHPWVTHGVSVKALAGSGVQQSLIGTIKRSDGSEQITYGGHPLYLYAHPTHALIANAQGAGGVWYIVGLNGHQIT
jgi:predicted lipoprotein with Yx(FWY)xxD motif